MVRNMVAQWVVWSLLSAVPVAAVYEADHMLDRLSMMHCEWSCTCTCCYLAAMVICLHHKSCYQIPV